MIPQFLSSALKEQYGKALAEQIEYGYSSPRPTTLRINPLKASAERVKQQLLANGIGYSEVPWYGDALVLEKECREAVQRLTAYERGEIYLQSLSSMLPPLILKPAAEENILDMTAAPGGKTTQMFALSNGKALITACEKDKIRFERLKFNVLRQGASRVNLLMTDATKLDEFLRFDKILLDAPCSCSGTIDARFPIKVTPKLVDNSAVLQKKLLKKALGLLKSGGVMVYSTCSVLREENDGVLQEVLPLSGGEILPIEGEFDFPVLPSTAGTLCVMPSERYEGFFVALIRKK